MTVSATLRTTWALLLALLLTAGSAGAQQGQWWMKREGSRSYGKLGLHLAVGDFSVPADGVVDLVVSEVDDMVHALDCAANLALLETIPAASWYGEGDESSSVHAADVDLDGFPDVVIGDVHTGWVYKECRLYYGARGSRSIWTNPVPSYQYLFLARIVGDVAGDRYPEIYGSTSPSGTGASNLWDFTTSVNLRSHYSGEAAGLGDADGNGYDEYAVIQGSGVLLWKGAASLPSLPEWQADPGGGQLGGLCGMSDVNGDGWPEVVAGAPSFNSGSGVVVVLSGRTGAELARYVGSPGDQLGGYETLAAGDLDGDGMDELIAGAPLADPMGRGDAGGVRILDLQGGSLVLMSSIEGDNGGEHFGRSVVFLGDVNGNGRADYAASSPYATAFGVPQAGIVFVFEGSGSPTPRLVGPATAQAGSSIVLSMSAARPGDWCLWLAAATATGSVLFGEPLELGQPQYLLDIGIVPLLGSDSLGLQLPIQLPPSVYFENLLVRPGSGVFGPKDTTNAWRVRIQ